MSCAMTLIFFSAATCSLGTVRGTRDESKEEKVEMTLEDGSKGDCTRQEIIIYHFIKMRETPENLKERFEYLEARVKYLASVLRTPDAYKNDVDWDYENMTALHKERKLTKIREIKKRKLVIATEDFLWGIKRDAEWKNFPIHDWLLPNITSELRRRELQALTTKEELDWVKGEIDKIKIMVDALKVCYCVVFLESAYFEKFIENDFEEIKELFEEKDQRFKDALSGC